ncbi:MAG TPA: sigma-70 family RNA polymerase sigma factor [Gemmataceae bacterium]|jgi:RNA polymerase sigma-70 factor (ECF subfamily)
MTTDTDDFRTLMRDFLAGRQDAAERLCRDYQSAILRVVRRTLLPQLRPRYDSLDFVNDVWVSFFADPPRHAHFDTPQEFTAYLARMARNKIGEVRRKARAPKHDLAREKPIQIVSAAAGRDGGLPAPEPTPSQIVGAEDEFQNMLRGRDPIQQRILTLLRQGMGYREVARRLNTHEKTIRRLVRQLDPEAPGHDRPSDRPR